MLNRNQVIQNSELSTSQDKKLKKNRVDINILLNRVRADKKKEKLETIAIISLVSLSVLATGLIVSL